MAEQDQRQRPALKVLAIFVLLVCQGILFSLGSWQAGRFIEKRETFALMEAHQAMPAVPLTSANQLGPELDYRNVALEGGSLQMDRTVVVERRFHKNLPGNWTLTPYEFADGSVVIVHTGWVPDEHPEALSNPPAQLQGIVVSPQRVKPDELAREDGSFALSGLPHLGELDAEFLYGKLEGQPPRRLNTIVALNGPEVLQVYPMPSVEHITSPYLTPAVHFGYAALWFGSAVLMLWLFWAGWTGRLDPNAR